jgi:seryl-tRNA synthetase
MLDLRHTVENLDEVTQALGRRGFRETATLDALAERGARRRSVIAELEGLRAERNAASQAMARLDKKSDQFATTREAMRTLGDRVKELEGALGTLESELEDVLLRLPNLPHASTPTGASADDNRVVRVVGEKPVLAFKARDHVDVGVGLGILDFERASKVSGARFSVLKGLGSRLERALMQFMLDLHVDRHGYTEVWPPVLIKDTAMRGTGQLPKFAAEAFRIAKDWDEHGETEGHDLYLAPTAEVPVTNLHADEILDAKDLPIAYTAYTPCFRSEAGSYGKDTRGLIRQHQFDKVELVRFCRPEDGEEQLELLTSHAEAVLQRLGLHYRVVQLCSADMGFAATKSSDLEVWLPGQDAYREISSCSWFSDFQARRASIRYRPEPKAKPRLVHTLNGSGLAIGRTLVAILEQNQQADGSVVIPQVLRPYMAGTERIVAAPDRVP